MQPFEIQDVPTNHPDLEPLIAQLDAYLLELYPPEEVFIADEEKAGKNEMQFIIMYMDNLPVGCGAIMRLEDGYAELKRFFVDPSVRNRGLAGILLSGLENRARDRHFGFFYGWRQGRSRSKLCVFTSSTDFMRSRGLGNMRTALRACVLRRNCN